MLAATLQGESDAQHVVTACDARKSNGCQARGGVLETRTSGLLKQMMNL